MRGLGDEGVGETRHRFPSCIRHILQNSVRVQWLGLGVWVVVSVGGGREVGGVGGENEGEGGRGERCEEVDGNGPTGEGLEGRDAEPDCGEAGGFGLLDWTFFGSLVSDFPLISALVLMLGPLSLANSILIDNPCMKRLE